MQHYQDRFQTHFKQDVSKFDFGFTTHPIDQDTLQILEPFGVCHIKDLLQVLENILKVTREHLMGRCLTSATGFDIYAFMDYRSQGQTLPHVIINIASPPTGTLTLFNLYVALSRSSR